MVTIYLADLTHCTVTISNDAFPLNVGLVGAYARKCFPDVHIELFKYPDDLQKAIDRKRPDILGCSNYPWTLDLSASFFRYVKTLDKNIITVMGGPNISYGKTDQYHLLYGLKDVLDFHTLYEGESAFRSLLEQSFANDFDLVKIKESPVRGCVYLVGDELQEYAQIERERNLTKFPSPYLTGLMDKFFDNRLSPMIETHRGCPFLCTFCHEGDLSYNKINRHEISRILDEIEYISDSVGSEVKNFMIADPNFGMFKEDIQIAEKIRGTYERKGYPNVIFATTAKNRQDRLIEISKVLRPVSLPIWLSVQSMTDSVLEKIKRKNIKVGQLVGVQKTLQKEGVPSKSELIMCLPGETFETHVNSIIELIELEIDQISCYQLMLVHGSEIRMDEATRREYEFVPKFRILARNFSEIARIGRSFEIEEIVVATKDFSFEEYLKARQLHLLISIYYNNKGFKGFFKYVKECQVDIESFMHGILQAFVAETKFAGLLNGFLHETKEELFNSESELKRYYSNDENFRSLIQGASGANLLQKYTSLFYIEKSELLPEVIKSAIKSLLPADAEAHRKLDDIAKYYELAFSKFLDPDRKNIVSEGQFNYDIAGWHSSPNESLDEYRYGEKKTIMFETPEAQFELVEKYFKRYGRSVHGMGKIMTRLWIVDMHRVPIGSSESQQNRKNAA